MLTDGDDVPVGLSLQLVLNAALTAEGDVHVLGLLVCLPVVHELNKSKQNIINGATFSSPKSTCPSSLNDRVVLILQQRFWIGRLGAVFRIRISLNADQDQGFYLNADQDSGFWILIQAFFAQKFKSLENFKKFPNFIALFFAF